MGLKYIISNNCYSFMAYLRIEISLLKKKERFLYLNSLNMELLSSAKAYTRKMFFGKLLN